jgi:hypothetical protein
MIDGPKEDFYVKELRTALEDYHRVNKDVIRLMDDRRQRARLVKSLLSVLKLQAGEDDAQELLDKSGLAALVRPFIALETLQTTGSASVMRRRRGERQVVDPSMVLPKGTRVKMLAGTYDGYAGFVASCQSRQGRRGLDVTYFLNLEGPKGDRKRTSVKHGTLNKSWVIVS